MTPALPALPAPRPAHEVLRGGAAARAGARAATLSEVFPATAADGAATGFLLASLSPGPVLWVQDRLSAVEAGRPWPPGLGPAREVLYLRVGQAADVLWAMEQGLGSRGLAAVVGEVWGTAPAVDFTATKRLAIRAEAQGVAAWLVRRGAAPDLSAARERWRVGALPSTAHPHDIRSPGAPLWRAVLFRARWRPPGDWVAHADPATGQLVLEQGLAAAEAPPIRQSA